MEFIRETLEENCSGKVVELRLEYLSNLLLRSVRELEWEVCVDHNTAKDVLILCDEESMRRKLKGLFDLSYPISEVGKGYLRNPAIAVVSGELNYDSLIELGQKSSLIILVNCESSIVDIAECEPSFQSDIITLSDWN